MFVLIVQIKAQTPDTTYVDTVSMLNIDSTAQDEEELYTDTTEKHIYDTSQNFFNWKENIYDPYTIEKIQQRSLPDSAIRNLKNSEDFWYIPAIEKIETRLKNDPAYRDSLLKAINPQLAEEQHQSFEQQPWFRTLTWCIIISVFSGALIYFLLQNKINIFAKDPARSATGTVAENEHADIFHIPYSELLRKADREGNYRGAVRLLYLQTLKLLSEANIIHYQPDYTNLHYVEQLYQTKFYSEFFAVTRHYEYIWYGKFEISQTLYSTIKNDFLTLQHKIAA